MGGADDVFARIAAMELGDPIRFVFRYGSDFVVMLGMHSGDGLCWCQPRATDRNCPVPGHQHYVYDHSDRVH